MKLAFDRIYLVATGPASHAEVRVTHRDSEQPHLPPKTVQFVALGVDENGNPLGVLDLTEDLWREWFGEIPDKAFLPGMETAQSAAAKMVRDSEHIHYGCPLCNARFTKLEEAQTHTAEEGQRVLSLFEVQEELICPRCGKEYVQMGSFFNHCRTCGGKE